MLPLIVVIVLSLAITLKENGIGSFVTLGVIGAAIYSVPALIDTQFSLSSTGTQSQILYVAVPSYVDSVVLIAWVGMLLGLMATTVLLPQRSGIQSVDTPEIMGSIALASAILAMLGLIYLSISSESLLFFLQQRTDQDTSFVSTLWKWTALIGLVSATFARSRRLLYFHALIVVIVFLRGDRTLVAIATAALIVTASYRNPAWYLKLKPSQIIGFAFALMVIFFGKSAYSSVKASFSGGAAHINLPLKQQLFLQFEPIATFSHLQFVMVSGLKIPPGQFLESIFGNLLMVPSLFGISTNLYNEVVTAALPPKLGFGVAGNYLAHGYTVGGTAGAALFYFILPLMLRLCDGQFRTKTGSVKVFWCCVGAVFAFYVHRNGLDNLFAFVRQILIVSIATAAGAAALRHMRIVAAPGVLGEGRAVLTRTAAGDDFVLRRSPAAEPPERP